MLVGSVLGSGLVVLGCMVALRVVGKEVLLDTW